MFHTAKTVKTLKLSYASIILLGICHTAFSSPDDDLSLEELTKTDISSVSRHNQSLNNVPAAAFVISAEDIRRSGALNLPDVLRLAPGIQVAQIDSGRYSISTRGFSGRFANKLEVMIDGRILYDPFFSGTAWEFDPIPLEDIERIEVIRGPVTAIWGANAVNGLINIITRHSRTQMGGMVTGTAGTHEQGKLYARAGGSLDDDTTWKLSAQDRHAQASKKLAGDGYSNDNLTNDVVDFRLDHTLSGTSDLSLWANAGHYSQGDLYPHSPNPLNPAVLVSLPVSQLLTKMSISGRYRWLTNQGIESSINASLTNSIVDLKDQFGVNYSDVNIDYHSRYAFATHDFLWGASYRSISDSVWANDLISVSQADFTQNTTGFFLHDNWTAIQDKLQLGLGARLDHTSNNGKSWSGNSFSPNATIMWTPTLTETFWAKLSKAPRIPARAEFDTSVITGFIPGSRYSPSISFRSEPGAGVLQPENMRGLELGFRSQLTTQFSIDTSVYRYRYTDLVSNSLGSYLYPVIRYGRTVAVQNLDRCNCGSAWVSGLELSADWLLSPAWRLQLSYSYTKTTLDDTPSLEIQAWGQELQRGAARHFGSLRSHWNVSANQQFDATLRGSSSLERTLVPYTTSIHVPGYVTLDLRHAYRLNKDVELAVTGRNLVGPRRIEYVSDQAPATPVIIGPSLLFSAGWKF